MIKRKVTRRITYRILSQPLYDSKPTGGRYPTGKIKRGEYEVWSGKDMKEMFSRAMTVAVNRCKKTHTGSIIFSQATRHQPVKIAQVKWGHDNRLFYRYEGSGEMLRRLAHLPAGTSSPVSFGTVIR